MVQQARSAMARTTDLVREALQTNHSLSSADVDRIAGALKEPLIDLPQSHGAVFGSSDAQAAGLPVRELEPSCDQWQLIWRLWTKYFVLGCSAFEGRTTSRLR